MSEPAAPSAPAPAPTPAPAPISAIDAIYGTPKPAAAAPPADPPAEPPADPPADSEPQADPDTPTPPDGEVEEVAVATLDELTSHLEVPPEFLGGLKRKIKVNGVERDMSIDEAFSHAQKVEAADTYLTDAKTKSKAMLDEVEQSKQAWATLVTQARKWTHAREAEIERDTKTLLTDKLKEEDPALYALRQNELRDRRERLEADKLEIHQGMRAAAQKVVAEQQAALQQRLPKERELFMARVPAWNDEMKAATVKYLTDDGYSLQEINAMAYDHRIMSYVVDSMQSKTAKAKLETTKKKVVKIPKILKPGPKATAPKPNGAAKTDPVSILYG